MVMAPLAGAQFDLRPGGDHVQPHARPDSAAIEAFEQFAVAFVDAVDGNALAGGRLIERLQSAASPAERRIGADDVAVRAKAAGPQHFDQLPFEIGRNGVLQLFGLIVDLVPFQTEDLGEHALDEVVAE